MSHNEDAVYVGHMLDMTRRAVKAVETKTRAKYDKDDILRLGLTHLSLAHGLRTCAAPRPQVFVSRLRRSRR